MQWGDMRTHDRFGPTRSAQRRYGPRWLPALLLAGVAAAFAGLRGVGGVQPVAVGNTVYLPLILKPAYVYVPMLIRSGPIPIGIIANPSFEDEHWYTDSAGNQWPSGWTFYSPENGQLMPFPTKQQQGNTVPAISGGLGEYVHKYQWQLPPDEYLGAVRGLILDGQLTYKAFSDHIPHALVLSQTLTYTVGRKVMVTGYILGETDPFRCGSSGILENDHFVASLQLGSSADTRLYVDMKTHFDVPGNERAWNKFSVTTQVPADGHLLLKMIVQSNWPCPVDFFIDHFEAFEVP